VSTLPTVQRLFQDQILAGGAGIEDLVAGNARADARTRLRVYTEAYRLRLLENLENDYPALRAFIGEEDFAEIGGAYIEAHPSATRSVRWFGRHLPDFLVSRNPAAAELARFEWTSGEVFDAADAEALEVAAMAGVPPEAWPEMHLRFQPALCRLDLRWNVPAIVQAVQAGQSAPAAAMEAEARAWLLWRSADLKVHWRPLDADEAAAIDAARAGASFGDVCERLCEWVEAEQAGLHAASLLKRWLADGLIAGIELPADVAGEV
jgi:hypothetical protein